MALIIEPRRERRSGFGGGLQTGLDILIQNRLQNVLRQEQSKRTEQGLQAAGFTPEEAQSFALLPPQSLNEIIKDKLAQPKRQAFASAIQNIVRIPSQVEDRTQLSQTGEPSQPEGLGVARTPPIDLSGFGERETIEVAKLISEQQKIASKERIAAKKQEDLEKKQEKKEKFKLKQIGLTETREYFKETNKKSTSAKFNNRSLDRMQQLIEEGDLSSPIFNAVVEKVTNGIFGFGLDISSLRNATDTEFAQLSKDFVRGAKAIFGARLTDADLRAFFQTIPTLMQSREGALRVMKNMKMANDGEILKQKIMNEIIADNKGDRPGNIEALVGARLDPVLDKMAADFRESYRGVADRKTAAIQRGLEAAKELRRFKKEDLPSQKLKHKRDIANKMLGTFIGLPMSKVDKKAAKFLYPDLTASDMLRGFGTFLTG